MSPTARLVAAVVVLALSGCQARVPEPAPKSACIVPRLAEEARRASPGQPLPDTPPKAGVLPTPELTDVELKAAGDCLRPALFAIARTSESDRLRDSTDWNRVSTQFYPSEHGRFLEVFANDLAAGYARFENGPKLPVGAVIKKQSLMVRRSGEILAGPQFLMERMPSGYDPRAGDWRFTLVTEAGAFVGETNGRNNDRVEYCIECHRSARRQDFLFFVPPNYRPKN